MSKISFIFLVFVFGNTFYSQTSFACSPARQTPQEIIENSHFIFVGHPIASQWGPDNKHFPHNFIERLWMKSFSSRAEKSFYFRIFPTRGKTLFSVEKNLKGDVPSSITIFHPVEGPACGVTFESHKTYLIFGNSMGKWHYTNVFGVYPFLDATEYDKLLELLDLHPTDLPAYSDFLEPIDAK